MAANPVVTIDSPQNGEARSKPFTVSGSVVPPDGVGTPGAIFLRNKATGELLATAVAPAGGGTWSAIITGAIEAMRAGTATPQQIALARLAGTAQPKAVSTARRSAVATPPPAAGTGTAQRASVAAPQGKAASRLSGTSQPQSILTARLSGTTQPNRTAAARRSGTAEPKATATVRVSRTITANGQSGGPALAQPSVFASPATNGAGTASATLTPSSVGNLLLFVAFGPDADPGAWSVTDDHNHTWVSTSLTTYDLNSTRYMHAWWAVSNTTASTTVTLTGDAWYTHAVALTEFSGVSVFDTAHSAAVLGTDPLTSGPITTAQAVEVLVGIAAGGGTQVPTLTEGTGWTKLGQITAGLYALALEYRVTASAGSYESTWTSNPVQNSDHIITAFRQDGVAFVGAGALSAASRMDGTTFQPALPAGVQSGDLLVLDWHLGSFGTTTTPSGWTPVVGAAGNGSLLLWKRAGASESAPSLLVSANDGEGPVAANCVARIYAFRGAYATGTPTDGTPTNGTTTDSSLTITGSAALTTTHADSMVVFVGGDAIGSPTFSAPGGSVSAIVPANGTPYGSTFLAFSTPSAAGSHAAPTVASTNAGGSGDVQFVTFAIRKA